MPIGLVCRHILHINVPPPRAPPELHWNATMSVKTSNNFIKIWIQSGKWKLLIANWLLCLPRSQFLRSNRKIRGITFWLLNIWVTLGFQVGFHRGLWFKASDTYYDMLGCLKWIRYLKNRSPPGKSSWNQLVYTKTHHSQAFVDHLQD